MKILKPTLIIIVILLIAGYVTVATDCQLRNRLFSDLQSLETSISKQGKPGSFIGGICSNLRQKLAFVRTIGQEKAEDIGQLKSADEVALYFKDGSVMIGKLIRKTKDEYVIEWKDQETTVPVEQVDHMGSPKEALQKKNLISDEEITKWWPYDNDVALRLTNRVVLGGKIKDVGEGRVILQYIVEGGGYLEQDVEYSKIEYLVFKPIDNTESKEIEATLKELFPKMEFYKEGNFTVVTDSDITWAREYIATLRGAYTDIYLEFFNLLKDRKPQIQNFVVMFDDYVDFVEYAIADGVPGWAVLGYFNPDDKVLYLFNILGKRFSEILFEGVVGESGRTIDEVVDVVESDVGERYRIFIEGEAKVIKDKFWRAYSYYKDMFRESTMSTLRHEFAHEVFYNWGLQNIILSKVEKNKDELVAKKKEFLETKDYKKKAELVKTLMALRAKEESLDMRAANSWLAEGIATYCETKPPGSQNDRWLFLYQEMVRKQTIYPLESLTVYKIGSFPGVCMEGMLYSYAQSWALVTFLMDRYPKEFMEYQNKMAQRTAKDWEDIAWLLSLLGKDIRTLEAEFAEYMKKFEKLEDPDVDQFMHLYNIFNEYE